MTRPTFAALALLAAILAGCALPPPPQPPATPDAYPAPVGALSAYPGPGSREPVPAPDAGTLVHRLYMPVFERTTEPSIIGYQTGSKAQALRPTTRARIVELAAIKTVTVRTGMAWKDVEPVQGVYIWPAEFDAIVNLHADLGNRLIVVLHWAPTWALKDKAMGCGPVAVQHYGAWLRWVEATVQRYGDRVGVWEILNEPDAPMVPEDKGWGCLLDPWVADQGGTEYGHFAAQTADVIRRTQPEATILSGGLLLGCEAFGQTGTCGGSGITFLYFALQEIGDRIDGVSFHSYQAWTGLEPAGIPIAATLLEAKITALRKITDLPLYLTESGFLCHYTAVSPLCESEWYEYEQSRYVYLWALTCRRHKLRACIWYSYSFNGWMSADLLNRDGTPSLAYNAFREVVRDPFVP